VFDVKDSGERAEFASGMVRDTSAGKTEWHRVADGPMLERWAVLLTKAVEKYPDLAAGVPNWTLASNREELERFRASAFRHFMQWFNGETDEDHAAAVMFNINGAEYVKTRGHTVAEEPPLVNDTPDGCFCPIDGSTCWSCGGTPLCGQPIDYISPGRTDRT
jgi:hypothetical protein